MVSIPLHKNTPDKQHELLLLFIAPPVLLLICYLSIQTIDKMTKYFFSSKFVPLLQVIF